MCLKLDSASIIIVIIGLFKESLAWFVVGTRHEVLTLVIYPFISFIRVKVETDSCLS